MKRALRTDPTKFPMSLHREFYYDPYKEIEVCTDIKDFRDVILLKAGSKIKVFYGVVFDDLLFIDGTSSRQLEWALQSKKLKPSQTLMLVKGVAKDLSIQYKTEMFEDTNHYLMNKLGIKKVPAIVTQKGDKIQIREFNL